MRTSTPVLLVAFLLAVPAAVALAAPPGLDPDQEALAAAAIAEFDRQGASLAEDRPELFPEGYQVSDRSADTLGPLLRLQMAAHDLARARLRVALGIAPDAERVDMSEDEIHSWLAAYEEGVQAEMAQLIEERYGGPAPAQGIALEDLVRRAWPAYHIRGNQEFYGVTFAERTVQDVQELRFLQPVYVDLEAKRLLALQLAPSEDEGPYASALTLERAVAVRRNATFDGAIDDPDVQVPARAAAEAYDAGRAFDALMYTLVAQYGMVYSRNMESAFASGADASGADPLPAAKAAYAAYGAMEPSLALHYANEMAHRTLSMAEQGGAPHNLLLMSASEALAWYDLVGLLRTEAPAGLEQAQAPTQDAHGSPAPSAPALGLLVLLAGTCACRAAQRD